MLDEEIEAAQHNVKTDAYQMSIGELVNMYKEGDLIINPDFQRLFRWEIGQKSRLIESILLAIPLPPIFVFERKDGKWELIDGLQRVSTILEFMGLLNNPDKKGVLPPSSLVSTKYLPSLHNVVWEISDDIEDVAEDDQEEIDKKYQLAIRRARIGVEILKRPSDNNTKYDLFQRLNAGGTQANPQELRNCIIVMVNKIFYETLKELSDDDNFRKVISATEDQIERQRHMELATRFLVHINIEYNGKLDIEEYINEGIVEIASRSSHGLLKKNFKDTFEALNKSLSDGALRRFDGTRHTGRVGLVAFECIAVGVGSNIKKIQKLPNPKKFIKDRVRMFWEQPELDSFLSQGTRGTTRIQKTIPYGRKWFEP